MKVLSKTPTLIMELCFRYFEALLLDLHIFIILPKKKNEIMLLT